MAKRAMAGPTLFIESITNLDGVTTATNGSSADMRWFGTKSVFITVTGNTGAVTVNIEASHDGTAWFSVASKTYTATNDTDIYSYASYFPYMRTTTSTQSNSTVSTVIVGRT